ncbi:MAG: winged helix-turn-helix transcriptional regulator [Bacteroidetes bacterium]|nr:winged helix-turn-helix transcriptional regulator [Bacteroidota bacterium]
MNNNQSCIRLLADEVQINACKDKIEASASSFTRLSNVLALAGNEVRLKIMFLLDEEKELCPCDLSDILRMSIPAISQHLRKMKDGNLIEARRSGQILFYSLKSVHLNLLKPIFEHIKILNTKEELV